MNARLLITALSYTGCGTRKGEFDTVVALARAWRHCCVLRVSCVRATQCVRSEDANTVSIDVLCVCLARRKKTRQSDVAEVGSVYLSCVVAGVASGRNAPSSKF